MTTIDRTVSPVPFEQVEEAAAAIRSGSAATPKIGLILGSGLGGFADELQDTHALTYESIPHFPRTTAPGHSGRLVLGTFANTPLAVMQGRVHAYEGYLPHQVVFPVRVLHRLGVRVLIVTNSAGGIRAGFTPGQLVLIRDHINLTGLNPLAGPNDIRFGERFFDMSDAYSGRLRAMAQRAASHVDNALAEGVYMGLIGPSFETPAEIRAFRVLGADVVGMSTVLEVTAARHLGIEVLGISCVSNMAAGVISEPIDHGQVLETGEQALRRLSRILGRLIPAVAETLSGGALPAPKG